MARLSRTNQRVKGGGPRSGQARGGFVQKHYFRVQSASCARQPCPLAHLPPDSSDGLLSRPERADRPWEIADQPKLRGLSGSRPFNCAHRHPRTSSRHSQGRGTRLRPETSRPSGPPSAEAGFLVRPFRTSIAQHIHLNPPPVFASLQWSATARIAKLPERRTHPRISRRRVGHQGADPIVHTMGCRTVAPTSDRKIPQTSGESE